MNKKDFFYIAVCDDDKRTHLEIEDLISEYGKFADVSIKLIHFYGADELLEYKGMIQILLLDIVMPGTDGIEAGRYLRNTGADYRIIMLTSMKEKAADSMKIGAFRFIEKPIDKVSFFEAFDAALSTFIGYKKTEVLYRKNKLMIFQYRIIHIKSMGNYVKVFTSNAVFDKNISIKKLLSELDGRMFIQTEKSHIVNLSFVNELERNKCILSDGSEIPVSRRAYKTVLEAYSEYDAKGYNGIRNGYFY